MMAYSERHRWCTSKIVETFAPELEQDTAQTFVRNDHNLQQFNAFFKVVAKKPSYRKRKHFLELSSSVA